MCTVPVHLVNESVRGTIDSLLAVEFRNFAALTPIFNAHQSSPYCLLHNGNATCFCNCSEEVFYS